jgi:hypothetical protein
VYGRRTELERVGGNAHGRPQLTHVQTLSYDRLRPQYDARNSACVQVKVELGRPVVVHVPPTFRLGPWNAEAIASFDGFASAVRRNRLMSDSRREFLLDRLPYWQELGGKVRFGSGSFGILSFDQWEW